MPPPRGGGSEFGVPLFPLGAGVGQDATRRGVGCGGQLLGPAPPPFGVGSGWLRVAGCCRLGRGPRPAGSALGGWATGERLSSGACGDPAAGRDGTEHREAVRGCQRRREEREVRAHPAEGAKIPRKWPRSPCIVGTGEAGVFEGVSGLTDGTVGKKVFAERDCNDIRFCSLV